MTDDDERNHRDFVALIQEVNTHLQGHVDFCYLPGDNADNGASAQYGIIKRALNQLRIPVHIIPGDHDREPGNLQAFYTELGVDRLPKSISLRGYRCLFLDIVSAGDGGPDFRLTPGDLAWLARELAVAELAAQRSVIFMHAYPAELTAQREAFTRLLNTHRVLVVDMGHTHYNELGNDGRIIFATTRSTGQVEEGPAGFSIMHLQGSVVSWRFKPLGSGWPFVMITTPADERLMTEFARSSHVVAGVFAVNARAWSAAGIVGCRFRVDQGKWIPMQMQDEPTRWSALGITSESLFTLTVEAEDRSGNRNSESIRVSTRAKFPSLQVADGSDQNSLGAWLDKHILGTQLGPNRNGRKW